MLMPALEIGGTHVSAGVVDDRSWSIRGEVLRTEIDSHADAAELLAVFAAAANRIEAPPGAIWGVAMPDPFDYARGVGRFHSVDKFESLDGVNLRTGLLERIFVPAADIRFVPDAEAFLLGEWAIRGAPSDQSWAAVTLGTGVGSGSLVNGRLVASGYGIPPGGRAHRLTVDGQPLEEVMSRRALMRAYRALTGRDGVDVREISALARGGDAAADSVLAAALGQLGAVLSTWLANFDVVVVGGSMTKSWDVLGPPFVQALHSHGATPVVVIAQDVEAAALVGAARAVSTQSGARPGTRR
jgi:glucokinase